MADRKISQLTELTTPSIAAQIPIVESASNFRASAENLVNQVLANSKSLPALQLHAATHNAGGTDPITVQYADVTGKPATFTPSLHAATHQAGGIDALVLQYNDIANKPSTFTPSSHAASHAVAGSDPIQIASSQVTNLTSDLAAKANLVHTHGNISNDGKIGSTSSLPIVTGSGGVLQAGAFGTAAGTVCDGADSRLSNARVPTLHASTHGIAGSDPVTLAQTQVTNLTADLAAKATSAALTAHEIDTTSVHGITDTSLLVVTTDARLSDARTPLSHKHGNIQNDGTVGTTANLPLITGASGIVAAGAFGTAATQFCQGNDSRLSDARTPTTHASTHAAGGSDPLSLAVATASVLGGIKVGNNLTITVDGILSVSSSVGLGTVTSVGVSGGTTGLTVTGSPVTTSGTITVGGVLAVASGGTGATTNATARSNLGATTVGGNVFTLANPNAVTFPRFNLDNTVTALDATAFRTAIGAGTSTTSGTVTSVSGTGTVNGIALTGTVTASGNLTLGGTLSGVSLTTQVTGTLPVANGGTGATTDANARTNLGLGTIATASASTYVLRAGDTMTGTLFVSQGAVEVTRSIATNNASYQLALRGSATGTGALGAQMQLYGNGRANAILTSFSDTNVPPAVVFRRGRGEQGNPAVAQVGDHIGNISFVAFRTPTAASTQPNVLQTASPVQIAAIRCQVTANYVSPNPNQDSALFFYVGEASSSLLGHVVIVVPAGLYLQGPNNTNRVISIRNVTDPQPDDNFNVWRSRSGGGATQVNDSIFIMRGYGTGSDLNASALGGFTVQQSGVSHSSTTGTDSQVRILVGAAGLGPVKELVGAEFSKTGQNTICANTQVLRPVIPCRAFARVNGQTSPVTVLAQSNMVVTKTAVGQYAITFPLAMPDTAYAISATASRNSFGATATGVAISNVTTSGFTLVTSYFDAVSPVPPTFNSNDLNIFVFRN